VSAPALPSVQTPHRLTAGQNWIVGQCEDWFGGVAVVELASHGASQWESLRWAVLTVPLPASRSLGRSGLKKAAAEVDFGARNDWR